jgi:hypothetical protein
MDKEGMAKAIPLYWNDECSYRTNTACRIYADVRIYIPFKIKMGFYESGSRFMPNHYCRKTKIGL